MQMRHKHDKENLDVDVRFLLANERTLLAWVRTGLAVIAAGVAVAFLSVDVPRASWIGVGAIIFGGSLVTIGYVRYIAADDAIRRGTLPAAGKGGVFIVLGVSGFALAIVLLKALT